MSNINNDNQKYTKIKSETLENKLDNFLKYIKEKVEQENYDFTYGIFLGGGYGRGEGGVLKTNDENGNTIDNFNNDLDFFVFTLNVSKKDSSRLDKQLKSIAEEWEEKFKIDIDFIVSKDISELQKEGSRLMYQELLRGHIKVAGSISLSQYIINLDAEKIPLIEGIRLFVNRGMGLLLATEKLLKEKDSISDETTYIVRNLHKCALGSGDGLLIGKHIYEWDAEKRLEKLKKSNILTLDELSIYELALKYKFSPQIDLNNNELKISWKNYNDYFCNCCVLFLNLKGNISDKTFDLELENNKELHTKNILKNILRWILRTNLKPKWSKIKYDPLTFLLSEMYAVLSNTENLIAMEEFFLTKRWQRLYKYWRIFN